MERTEGAKKTGNTKWLYLMVLVAGLLLWIIWGTAFNAYTDIGLYSIVILMVLFGLGGFALYSIAPDGGKK